MGLKLWADSDFGHRAGKTFTTIRIDEVIAGSLATKYNYDHPVEGLVRGDNIVEIGGVRIPDLAPSITTGWINEADKLNIVNCVSINPFRATVKVCEQGELVIQESIHQYLYKLGHDCGHPNATKMVDILMQDVANTWNSQNMRHYQYCVSNEGGVPKKAM